MRRPVIGLVGYQMDHPAEGRPAAVLVGRKYLDVLRSVGALPWVVPPVQGDREFLEAIANRLQGLFLTGGIDLDPARYGEERHPACGVSDSAQDESELALLAMAAARGLPVFAVCRGIQVLNVSAGGTLYQDIAGQVPAADAHYHPDKRAEPVHDVFALPGSRLAELLGEATFRVNSVHHQAIKDLGTGLRPTAYSPDGVIEGVEGADGRFIVGVQWHPEELIDVDDGHRRLFAAFIAASSGAE